MSNDIQKEMIRNLKEKNSLLAVVQSTKAFLHEVAMKALGLEKERQNLWHEIQLKRLSITGSDDKEEIDIYIHRLDQRVNELNSEIDSLSDKKKEYETELEEKESKLAEIETKFKALEESYNRLLDRKGMTINSSCGRGLL